MRRGVKKTRYNGHKSKRRVPSKKAKMLNPQDLIKKAVIVDKAEQIEEERAPFSSYDFHQNLLEAIDKKGFKTPTPIQEQSFESMGEGKNIIGIANTGTGKTGAFLIPIIDRLLKEKDSFQTLVVLPTRELALQVEVEFKSLTKGMKFYSTTLIGGTKVYKDAQKLKRHHHVIIGTPGRILDMVKQKNLNLRPFSVLILDEFDRMLDMGFVKDVQNICHMMRDRKQTVLFSATIQSGQEYLVRDIAPGAISVKVSSGKVTGENIDQDIIRTPPTREKFDVLCDLLHSDDVEKALIFAETKRNVDRLANRLMKAGFKAEMIHGDKTQSYRVKALKAFTRGKVNILVATDVAARGIDIDDISHVINYQMPQTMDSYIHRIGRTGRAGRLGKALTFVDEYYM